MSAMDVRRSMAMPHGRSLPLQVLVCRSYSPACESVPMLLDPENTLFVRGATPVLLLADAPVHDALPLLAAPDGAVPRCEG
ncbi:hypothetical protein SAMN02745898_101847 [Streptomyces sp. 136MFCol5.1]|jgi:hypothetical protein|nr:hypothetical protein SAMN02745898_101847 [Streptomyces sp. 136MFCol5.1]